ncbi:MAG: formate dehydrogenase accessory protein FdhE, partial [Alphaproteobacteria bacterium]|nr:formate dehydrogenase accessory protein FdhE [Alphaproteobacteria bacterium]
MLPDPPHLFARRAARLDALAAEHPMADWLRFMATLARAQHAAVPRQRPSPVLDDALARARAAG